MFLQGYYLSLTITAVLAPFLFRSDKAAVPWLNAGNSGVTPIIKRI
jgi:hypothetical protein